MKSTRSLVLLGGFLVLSVLVAGCGNEAATESGDSQNHAKEMKEHDGDEEHKHAELAPYMSKLQRYSHKLGRSVDARNAPLGDFYLHEIEELTEEIKEDVPEYEGHEIGQLMEQILEPRTEDLDDGVDAGDWEQAAGAYAEFIEGCNNCHMTTDHGFIRITEPVGPSPFNQDFSPKK